ncbi:MAG TPA: right-handed parallel beta-helix repeat-containing protein [Opitutaceae bacterium]|nr:right-handed parallel beta-helix repeat-containing protein [Opitutaceae bacterium]
MHSILLSSGASRLVVAVLAIAPLLATAQPSGGPYGPQPQTYEVPADAAHVYYVAPDGSADATGASIDAPTTLEAAIARVVTGDAIILRGGTYRTGGLVLNQGVSIQPYRDENPVLKGTRVAAEWTSLREGVWRTSWATLFPSEPLGWWHRDREGSRTPLHRFNNDMLFIDGVALRSAGWAGELDATSYYIDYDAGHVFIRADPTGKLVEITAHDSALVCTPKEVHGKKADNKGPAIRGITFTQYAYRALEVEGKRGSVPSTVEPTDDPIGLADPATFGKEVVGTLLENVTITHCSRVAGYFRGDNLVIRNCLVSDTSTEGIYVIASSDCLLERNIIARNNVEQLTGYYPSAVKIFNQTRRVVCRDNLVIDHPHSNGIWYDVGNRDGVFVNNWIEGATAGLFFEISQGVVAAGNVFVNCETGVRILNSADARIYNNTFVNSGAGFTRDGRGSTADHFAWHPSTGPGVDERTGHVFEGNLVVIDKRRELPAVYFWQPENLCDRLTMPNATGVGGNAYMIAAASGQKTITWSPMAQANCVATFDTLDAFRAAVRGFEVGSVQVDATLRDVFQSPELKNFKLTRPIDRAADAPVLPEEVRELLGWSEAQARTVGAYPFVK